MIIEKFFYRAMRVAKKKLSRFKKKIHYNILRFSGDTYKNKYHAESGVKFYVPSFRSFERAVDAHSKEKITRDWVASMRPGEVLWDVGANVGVFTLLAAKRNINVVAFEPLYSNYYLLSRNIELNPDVSDKVMALPVALAENNAVDRLYIPTSDPGYSGVSFGQPVNQKGGELDYSHIMNILGLTGNTVGSFLPNGFAKPDYIKIDVDGLEDEILNGLWGVLNNSSLKSILVEVDEDWPEKKMAVEETLKSKGFVNSPEDREPTVVTSRNPSAFNCIFRRD